MATFTERSRILDNSSIALYKACPRKYFIRQVLGWTGTSDAIALSFGGCWHAGMDYIWTHASDPHIDNYQLREGAMTAFLAEWVGKGLPADLTMAQMEELNPRHPGVANEMYFNYIEDRQSILRQSKVIACERPFAVPLPGMGDTWYIGKLDKFIDYNGQRLTIEHKTTTAYAVKGNFRTEFLNSWFSAPQVKGYEFATAMYYEGHDGVWVDASLVHKKVHNAFKFIPVKHQDNFLKEWLYDTREWSSRIQHDTELYEDNGKLMPGVFPRNEDSCYGKYGTCPFLDVCSFYRDPSELESPPEGFKKERWEPFDTLGLQKLIEDNSDG